MKNSTWDDMTLERAEELFERDGIRLVVEDGHVRDIEV